MKAQHPDAGLETLLVRVTGRVQGVGYRASAVREAHRLKVTGWVRNELDGTVQALLQGTPDQVDHMLEWMRHGPPMARVTDLITESQDTTRRFDRFEQT
ncbi:acylphosphatase [Achromobacter sp. GG226]|uniref:acylphosphatase n=1 Tax=Verticiella alkaliphila TaxID=2779529 RepID=UPI001C0BA8B4|nr:acylphosphatase [Verticiella sp. GG226]MBU4612626.1 acylphosphatase [Verticiella sp. GG226]